MWRVSSGNSHLCLLLLNGELPKAKPERLQAKYAKPFGILIECSGFASGWDTSGMVSVKCFGILIEATGGGAYRSGDPA